MNAKIDNYLARVYFSISRCLEICTIVMLRAKKYIEPAIQMYCSGKRSKQRIQGKDIIFVGEKGIRGYWCRSGFNNYKKQEYVWSGTYSGICPGGGLNFFIFPRGLSTRWGLKTP